MDKNVTKFSREELELMSNTEAFLEKMQSDSLLMENEVPSSLETSVMNDVRAYENLRARETQKQLSAEEKELMRLGGIYKRKRKFQKYYVLAAILILAFAFGTTGVGEGKKIFEHFEIFSMDREQTQVNSGDDTKEVDELSEEQAYEEIEKEYGFYPVRLNYRPEGVEFQEVSFGDEILGTQLIYGTEDSVGISYIIQPNYRNGSIGSDIEDELIESYQEIINGVTISVRKYLVVDNTERWWVQFEYGDALYSMLFIDIEEAEVEKTVQNLYFP